MLEIPPASVSVPVPSAPAVEVPVPDTARVPADRVTPPLKVFAPLRVRSPVPALVMARLPPDSLITPLMAIAPVLLVTVVFFNSTSGKPRVWVAVELLVMSP